MLVHAWLYNQIAINCPTFLFIPFFSFLSSSLIIAYTKNLSQPAWQGYFFAVIMFAAAVVQSLFLHQYFHRCFLAGMRIRTAVVSTVYKKVYFTYIELLFPVNSAISLYAESQAM